MNCSSEIDAYSEENEQLEEKILTLEIENHNLLQKIRNFEFEHYKLQEIQKLAKAGSWELNYLSYNLKCSDGLKLILDAESVAMADLSWYEFLELIPAEQYGNFKNKLLENVIQMGEQLVYDHKLSRLDGHTIYVRHHCKTFYNSIG